MNAKQFLRESEDIFETSENFFVLTRVNNKLALKTAKTMKQIF